MQKKTTREIFEELRNQNEDDLQGMLSAYTNAISKLEDDPFSLRIFLDYVELSNKFLYSDVDELGYVYWFMKSKLRIYKLYWVEYIRFEVGKRKKRNEDSKVLEWLKVKEFSGKNELVDSLIRDKNVIIEEDYMNKEEELFNKNILIPFLEDKKGDKRNRANDIPDNRKTEMVIEYNKENKNNYENCKSISDSSSCDLSYLTKRIKEISEQTESLTIDIRESSLNDLENGINNHLNIQPIKKIKTIEAVNKEIDLINATKRDIAEKRNNEDDTNEKEERNEKMEKYENVSKEYNEFKDNIYKGIKAGLENQKNKMPVCELEIMDCGPTLEVCKPGTRKKEKEALECTLVENTTCDIGKEKIVYGEVVHERGGKQEFLMFKGRAIMKICKIGRGGYSVVHQVLVDNVIYAWKQMRVDDQEGLNKCVEEIAILKKLGECPFIINLVDYEILGDRVNMLFEYGEIDLQKLINSRRLDKFYIKYLWKSIVEILDFIYQKRIIHRDIKPANFVLVRGVVKLIDFGISKRIRADTTSVINLEKAGTMNYISPEQCVGGKISRSTDVWSARCILYFMVYNRHVFVCKSIMDIIRNMGEEHPIEYEKADPLAIETMKMCLQYDPRARAKPHELLKHKYLE